METSAPRPAAAPRSSLQRTMRTIHRVLGYLALALTFVYALSGITLIHRTSDFMKHEVAMERTLDPALDADALGAQLKIKGFKATGQTDTEILFKEGSYNRITGVAQYTVKEYVPPFDSFAKLHKLPDAQNHAVAWFTTTFGIVLFLLALTSLFMYKVSTRQFARNMLYTALGVVLAVVLLCVI